MDEGLQQFLRSRLEQRGDRLPLGEADSLFISGRLDSLDLLQTVDFLEKQFQIDFASLDFSLELIDTPACIQALIDR